MRETLVNLEELANELGTSTTDLVAAATELGLAGVTPTSTLTPDQAAALRTRFAGPAAPATPTPPTPPPGFAGPPPAVPTTPPPPPGFPGSSVQAPTAFTPMTPQAPAGFPPPGGETPAGFAPQSGPTPSPYASRVSSSPSTSSATPPKKKKVRGGLVLVVAAIAAVIGIAAFVVSSGDEDSGGSDAAVTEPTTAEDAAPEDVGPTGPNGKPLTEAEKEGLAKMKEAEAANTAKACATLKPISEADQNEAPIPDSVDTFEEVKQYAVDEVQRLSDLYEPAIAALPSQAEGMRKIQATYQGLADAFAGAATIDELDARLAETEDRFTSSGALGAANDLDAYAQDNCGFSINQN